jgi:hypothetical protein
VRRPPAADYRLYTTQPFVDARRDAGMTSRPHDSRTLELINQELGARLERLSPNNEHYIDSLTR